MIKGIALKFKKNQFLFEELVKRDFKKKYKGTVLGMIWSVLSPLLTLLVMRIVFTNFFGTDIPHYTTYLFCGNLLYSFFQDSTSQGLLSLLSNAEIFSKINVPKYLFLLSKNVQALINFGFTFAVFLIFCIFDGITFTFQFFMLFYAIFCILIYNIGMGLILSALYIFFRDMQYLWSIFTMILMYASAIFYSIDTFPENVQKLFYINPVYQYIYYFRSITIDGVIPSFAYHLLMLGTALLFLLIGAWMYKKYNTKFLYYI